MQKNFSRTKGENLVLGLLWFGLSSLLCLGNRNVVSQFQKQDLFLVSGSRKQELQASWIKIYLSLIFSSRTSYICRN